MSRPKNPEPRKRKNLSGKTAWLARVLQQDGRYKSVGTFSRKGEAVAAVAAGMDREWSPVTNDTVGSYVTCWITRHPRADRTNRTNQSRLNALLEVEVEGVELQHWRYADLRRRHVVDLVDHMLREQRRAHTGVQNIVRTWSAMSEDAITDEVVELNAFKGVVIRSADPRIQKERRAIRIWSWKEMYLFADSCGEYRPLVRLLADCFPRIGEALAIHQDDIDRAAGMLRLRWTLDEGRLMPGTKTDHGSDNPGRDVPLAPSLQQMLWEMPWHAGTQYLFPTPTGKPWRLSNFYRDVWRPAQASTGMDIRPHEMRHSAITHLAATGVDPADLAQMAGHSLVTMNGHYRQAKKASYEAVKELIG